MHSELDSCQNMNTLNLDFYRHLSLYVDLPPGTLVQSLARKAVILTTTAGKGKVGTFISFLDKLFWSPACRLKLSGKYLHIDCSGSYFKNQITFPYM